MYMYVQDNLKPLQSNKTNLFTFSFQLPLIDIQNSFDKQFSSSQSSTSSTQCKQKLTTNAVTLYM